ncbi:MAG: beta-lactamase family protein [Clostridiales bacterium]|nr:beta-lactamase family protein [Clostridiales bacterium]
MKKQITGIMAWIMLLSFASCTVRPEGGTTSETSEPDAEPTTVTEAEIESEYSLSKIKLAAEERSWINPESKYSDIVESYSKERCNGAYLVATDEDVLYLYCEDASEKDGTTITSQDTIFDMASVSKTFTAVAVIKLAEDGKLTLEDTLDKYFPEYETGKKITIYNLLHMKSGIPDYCNDPDPFWNISGADAANKKLSDIFLDKIGDEEFLQALYKAPLNFEPGTQYEYSNSNYHILAFVIEKVSGMKYCDYVKEMIFDKCGMTKTSSMAKDDMTYVPVDFEELAQYGFTDKSGYPAGPNNYRGDSGIHSCLTDMIKFDRALFTGKLLNEQSMKTLLTDDNGYCCGLMKKETGYMHDGSSFTCQTLNRIIESDEFGHIYEIRLERTGSVHKGDVTDPMEGTDFKKGVFENNVYSNEFAGIKVEIPEGYQQIPEDKISDTSEIVAGCDEERDKRREAATRWDCSFYSIDDNIHDNVHFKYVNVELAAMDGQAYTVEDYLDDFCAMNMTEEIGWDKNEGRQTVTFGGNEYVRQVYSGYDSYVELPEKSFLYARMVDDKVMSVIWIIAFYEDAAPADYEKLFK